jgi:hypothetical protein
MITQEILKERFDYNPETGLFIRLTQVQGCRYRPGTVVETKDTKGYIIIGYNMKTYKAHRLAWLYVHGYLPIVDIDHINRDTSDNRLVNLREVTHEVNMQNQSKRSTNTSGITGVYYDTAPSHANRTKKWRACIMVAGKHIHLGWTHTKEEAIKLRDEANIKYNFIV